MRLVRSRRRKVGWSAAVAVAIAVVGHAFLMAGGGHPAEAAHAVPAPVAAAPHESTAHHATTAPDVALRSAHASHEAPLASHTMHGPTRPPVASFMEDETTVEPHPTGGDPAGGDPAGDRTDACGGIFVLAWPQSPAMPPISGAASAPPSLTADLVISFDVEPHIGASRLEPTAPSGNRRALLQVYRL